MTDEHQNDNQDPKTEEPPAKADPEPEEKLVPAHRMEAVEAQAREWKSKFRDMEKRMEAIDAEKAAEEDEKLRKAQDFEKIEEGLKAKLAEAEQAKAELVQARTVDKLELALAQAGFKDEHGIVKKGILADRLESENPLDDIDAWLAPLAEQYPERFGQTVATPQTRAGSPDHGSAAGDDLDKRLASPDLAVRSAAIREKQELRRLGKL